MASVNVQGEDSTGVLTQTNINIYIVRGVFLESRSEGRVAVIAHDPVPGYMDAMTMPFNVRRPEELRALKSGDQISFRLSVTDSDDWIDQIKKSKGRQKPPRSSAAALSTASELQV